MELIEWQIHIYHPTSKAEQPTGISLFLWC